MIAAFHKVRKATGTDNAGNSKFDFTQVGMRKDLTPKEREEEAALFDKLKKRRQESQESGDEYARWIRRKGR